jgi:hypothetical protein
MAEGDQPAPPAGPQYAALPAWNPETRRPAANLTNEDRQDAETWRTYLARPEGGYTPDRKKTGFTQYTQGNALIPRAGQRAVDNTTQIQMAGLAKRNTIDRNLISQQGLQRTNARRYKQYQNSPYEHNKPFSPYEGQFDNDPASRLQGHYVVWSEANGKPGWQEGEKVVAVDGYKMKRLPNSQILAGFINEQRAHPGEKVDFKKYVRWARDQQYKTKHNGAERQQSAIAAVGTVTGEIYRAILDQIAPYKVVGEGRDAKPKRTRTDNGKPLPRGLFAAVNADMYKGVQEYVFANKYGGQPLPNTKEAQKAFSRAVADNAEEAISEADVLKSINDHLGTNFRLGA